MAKADFTIIKNDQLLMVRPIGAWGESIAKQFIETVNQYLVGNEANFAGLIDLRQWQLGTPEALKIIGKNISYAASLGYKLEIHFGQPLSLPVKISEKKVTPKDVSLHQCATFTEVDSLLSQSQYLFNSDELQTFLK